MSHPGGQTLRVRLQQDDRWPPFDCEEVRGQPAGDHRFRVTTAPAFAKRLAVDDIVTVHRDEVGDIWVDAVVEPGNHSTIRVILMRPERAEDLTADLVRHGCQVSPSPLPGLLTVDVPGSADYSAVRHLLEAGERPGDWEFQEATVSPHHEPPS